MKKYLLLYVMICASAFLGIAQKGKPDKYEPMFRQAEAQVKNEQLPEAIESYKGIVKIAKKNSIQYCKATYNIGYIHLMLKDDSSAKVIFQHILNPNFKEFDKGGKGSGIMQEPYALYKHYASQHLAQISMRENKYQDALDYMEMASNKYPYRNTCGNENYANYLYVIEFKSRAYLGLRDTSKALDLIMPEMIGNGLASTKKVVSLAVEILSKQYSKDILTSELDKALESIVITDDFQYEPEFTITFMRWKIEGWLPLMGSRLKSKQENDLPLMEKIKLVLQREEFYKQLSSL